LGHNTPNKLEWISNKKNANMDVIQTDGTVLGWACEVAVQVGGGGVKLNSQWSMNVFQNIQSLYGCKN
jgi:hypothetical protein